MAPRHELTVRLGDHGLFRELSWSRASNESSLTPRLWGNVLDPNVQGGDLRGRVRFVASHS